MGVSTVTSLSIVSVFLFIAYKTIIYPAFLSPLSKIPNAHWSASVSPAWILWKRFRSQNNRTIQAAHERLGPIVRLSPSEISVNCVEGGIKTIYTGGFEKHDWYPRVFGSFGTVSMFTMTGSKDHSVRKRMISNIYSKSFLQSSPHMRIISKTMIYDRLLPILYEAATSDTPVDVHDLNQGLTMDFVSAYLYGLKNATNFLQDTSYRQRMIYLYQCRKPFEFYHQEVPNLISWAKSVGIRLIPRWCDQANEILDTWALGLCDKAEACLSSTKLEDEPTVYRQLRQTISKQLPAKDDPESYAQNPKQQRLEIACELYDHLTAGHETSAVALTYLFWELSKHPELQKALREELSTLDPKIVYPPPSASAELPSAKSIDSLPLLEAIVTETLRLHAPIPGIQPRVTPSPSCTLAGYKDIPADTRVNAQAYSLHRNPEVFPEPENWEPKRWLKGINSPSELDERRRWFWAFGSGGRMCVGSNLALQGSAGLSSCANIKLTCPQR
ncbi:cytochrome P450 [Aspergillus clavatus NRRL 1]|uniref:Cytochrome P450 monooxygenase, putative n=1 Tax=Aspergillus clavatus (strain ATCC 1007 / CBS 513.65 / DSM 816 / NCTC 3887 / NRRL 1 / QM 1276 / 107) TaxID=344612 RepID=A1CRN8_ASPCL|nr:cytochrome P450 monooxygenase, putative [Aspergillus clavatus NRRL 1]EAW08309.1 cytochrome P450 monooxygenase, putative [Aspergillus clavatus NRRL 1]